MDVSKIKPIKLPNGKWKLSDGPVSIPKSIDEDLIMKPTSFHKVFNSENEAWYFLEIYTKNKGKNVLKD